MLSGMCIYDEIEGHRGARCVKILAGNDVIIGYALREERYLSRTRAHRRLATLMEMRFVRARGYLSALLSYIRTRSRVGDRVAQVLLVRSGLPERIKSNEHGRRAKIYVARPTRSFVTRRLILTIVP